MIFNYNDLMMNKDKENELLDKSDKENNDDDKIKYNN